MDRKLIYILLFIVIISAGVLIHKINSKPKYDKEVYDQVYKEYEEIISNKNEQENLKEENDNTIEIYQNARGISYRVIATISIPKINVHLPIISTTSDELLEIAPTKFFGPEVNQIGNFCMETQIIQMQLKTR